MLSIADRPLIENSIWKRLHQPGKTEIADIEIRDASKESPPHIKVGVWIILRDRVQEAGLIDVRSFFDLPAEFERRALLNEIDEIDQKVKEARQKTAVGRLLWNPGRSQPRERMTGTGLRGRWGV